MHGSLIDSIADRSSARSYRRGTSPGRATDRPTDHLVDVTDQRGERDVELLAGPLRPVLAAKLADGRGPRARLVGVVGSTDVPAVEAGPMLDVLRNELGALGVVLTSVDPGEARA